MRQVEITNSDLINNQDKLMSLYIDRDMYRFCSSNSGSKRTVYLYMTDDCKISYTYCKQLAD